MSKSLSIQTRPRLLFSIFVIVVFILGFITGSENLPSTETLSTQSRESSTESPLNVAIIVSPGHTLDHARQTLQSLNDVHPNCNIQIIHQTATPQGQFATLNVDYSIRTSRRPYDNPVHILPSDSPPTLLVTAGTRFAYHSIAWLSAARHAYAHRPDVAAFALDAVTPLEKHSASSPDHDASAWKPVKLASNSALLFRACPQATAIMFNNRPPHFQPWATFSEWLSLRRSDWYRFPSGPGIDNTPFGMSALPERNWTRGSWNVWFSKFLDEYQLSVVSPNVGEALVVNDQISSNGVFPLSQRIYRGSGRWVFNDSIRPILGSGKMAPATYFTDQTMGKIAALGRSQGGVISFTLVNKVFLDTTHSWLCNVDQGGFRPKGLLWAVTDPESNDELSRVDKSATLFLDEVQGGKSTGHEFGNPGYWKLMLERTSLITEILTQGIALFAFETDAIWLEDPFPYIDELVSQDADIVGTINTRMEVSGNFFFLRPTLPTRRLWLEITSEFSKAYEKARFENKKPDSWTYIENDQSLLTKLVLRNETWRKSYPLTFLTLDMEKFVDGRWYKPEEGFYTSERAREPVVINNNFAIGVKDKTERAKKFGHWFWDESNKKCMRDVLNKALRPSKH